MNRLRRRGASAIRTWSLIYWNRDRATIRVRVIGNHNVSVIGLGGCNRQVNGSGFFRVGKCHGGKSRVGVELLDHRNGRGEAGLGGGGRENLPTDTVHGGIHHGEVSVLGCDKAGGAILIGGDHRLWNLFPVAAVREVSDLAAQGHLLNAGTDVGVRGRNDLGTGGEIHLVAVVLGWVVTGGHHDTGTGMQVTNRKREYGCGNRVIEYFGRDPVTAENLCTDGGE